jgi:acyl carrier protein
MANDNSAARSGRTPQELAQLSAGISTKLTKLLEDFTQDWDHEMSGKMTRETKLAGDLGFESIDIIQLVVAIEEDITQRKMPFDQLLMKDGRYVDDLNIGQISDFLAAHL